MELFDIKSTGIFNSQIFRLNTKISEIRVTTMFELELPMENGGVSYIDSENIKITPDIMICAKPGQKRHTKFPFKCYYIHVNIYDSEIFNAAVDLPNFIQINDNEKYIRLFKSMIKHCNSKCEDDKYMVYSQFLKLIYLLVNKVGSSKKTNNFAVYNNYIETAIGYIDDHLSEKLSLNNVACAVSLSPVYFHNIFKAATGQTLHDYIEDKRIKKSIDLMQTTDLTLADIAYSCGFSSQSYFSYAFKRRMNTAPRNYIHLLNDNYDI